jgi:hypothetical protein
MLMSTIRSDTAHRESRSTQDRKCRLPRLHFGHEAFVMPCRRTYIILPLRRSVLDTTHFYCVPANKGNITEKGNFLLGYPSFKNATANYASFALEASTGRTEEFGRTETTARLIGVVRQRAIVKAMTCSATRRGAPLRGTAICIRTTSSDIHAIVITPAKGRSFYINITHAVIHADTRILRTERSGKRALPVRRFDSCSTGTRPIVDMRTSD